MRSAGRITAVVLLALGLLLGMQKALTGVVSHEPEQEALVDLQRHALDQINRERSVQEGLQGQLSTAMGVQSVMAGALFVVGCALAASLFVLLKKGDPDGA